MDVMAISANEQYLLELINRARANPNAEASRYGIDLNDNLAPGTIDGTAKQPLAFESHLQQGAEGHSADMRDNSYFSHTGLNGSSATDRAEAAGWFSIDPVYASYIGENISAQFRFTDGGSVEVIEAHHEGLFRSAGHRENILLGDYAEIGVGQQIGTSTYNGTTYPQASYVTELFGFGGRTYITGVAIDDTDNDSFYDVGEGLSGVEVSVTGSGFSGETTTLGAGGYAIVVPGSGTYTLTFSGGGIGDDQSYTVNVNGENVKVDAIADDNVSGSGTGSGTGSGGAGNGGTDSGGTSGGGFTGFDFDFMGDRNPNRIVGTGYNDDIVGLSGADTLLGKAGDDSLAGGGGFDALNGGPGNDSLHGGRSADTEAGGTGNDEMLGGAGFDLLLGEAGDDRLYGQDGNDTVNGGADDDLLFGQKGADLIFGGSGDDSIAGGAGNDTMDGGAGDDLYVFNGGVDTISFADGDTLSLEKFHYSAFDDIAHLIKTNGAGQTILDLPRQHEIIFETVPTGGLDAGDFTF